MQKRKKKKKKRKRSRNNYRRAGITNASNDSVMCVRNKNNNIKKLKPERESRSEGYKDERSESRGRASTIQRHRKRGNRGIASRFQHSHRRFVYLESYSCALVLEYRARPKEVLSGQKKTRKLWYQSTGISPFLRVI